MLARAEAERLVSTVPTEPYFAGRWDSSQSIDTFDVIDPVTERRLTTVAAAGAREVDRAVSYARSALDEGAWGRTDGSARTLLLYRLADLIEARSEEFAILELMAQRRFQRGVVGAGGGISQWC